MSAPWFLDLLGLPWKSKAVGPDAFDCWGLVVHVMRDRFGVLLNPHPEAPSYDPRAFARAVIEETSGPDWFRVETPIEGDVVLMARNRVFTHIGIYTEGAVLHSAEGRDVCHESITHIERSGVSRFEYWRNRNA